MWYTEFVCNSYPSGVAEVSLVKDLTSAGRGERVLVFATPSLFLLFPPPVYLPSPLPHIPRSTPTQGEGREGESGFVYPEPVGMRSAETLVRRQVTGAGRTRIGVGRPPAGALGAGGEALPARMAQHCGASSLPSAKLGPPR